MYVLISASPALKYCAVKESYCFVHGKFQNSHGLKYNRQYQLLPVRTLRFYDAHTAHMAKYQVQGG